MSEKPDIDQSRYLSVLAQADPKVVKDFVEDTILKQVTAVTTRRNRVGSLMVPGRDTVTGIPFHLGEALIAEAEIEVDGSVGYAACLGRDLEFAVAIAVVDAVVQAGRFREEVGALVTQESERLAERESTLLQKVEATKVDMETFEW